ncbi:MAG: thiamine-phosphate kinase [Alphaproteobacteria bacterium]|nr:thiamine-phosphate kinase [Alphaproteobacteria bacterium]MDE2162562.1 thiamine-phosphate kinase [Alphaproteobacteria bacterium]
MAKRPSEFALIAKVFAPLATSPGAFDLRDDAAVLPAREGCDLVVTTDALVEGVHFLASDPPGTVAKKALRVNLSDLAAKGAEPVGYLLALSLPERVDEAWLESFAQGLGDDQAEFNVSLLGGDTTATPGPLTLAITAMGHVPTGGMICRAGAVAGDAVFISGTIGDGGGGLAVLKGDGERLDAREREELVARYRTPPPRLALGQALRGVASAALDVSDGLIADLAHITEVSGVRIVVEVEQVPYSQALRALWGDTREGRIRAVTSGDDYEIAFTARSEAAVLAAARRSGVPVTRIGWVEAGSGVALLDADGREIPLSHAGFTHF